MWRNKSTMIYFDITALDSSRFGLYVFQYLTSLPALPFFLKKNCFKILQTDLHGM